jgi:hypothetical protein
VADLEQARIARPGTKAGQAIAFLVANMALFEEMIEKYQGDGVGR